MQIRKTVLAAVAGLWIGLSGAAIAAMAPPPPITVTVTQASGVAGSTVKPTFSFDVNGFLFESIDLRMTFTDPLLTFDLASSTVSYNGGSSAWTSLPNFNKAGPSVLGDVAWFSFSSFAAMPEPFTGALVLRPAFTIRNGAPLGATAVTVAGSIGTDAVFEERSFDHSVAVTVSAVPEPELWLLWLGGIGLLAWKRSRLHR